MTALIMTAALSAMLLQIGCAPKRPEPAALSITNHHRSCIRSQKATTPTIQTPGPAEEIQQAEGKSRRILEACEYTRTPYNLKRSHRLDSAIQQANPLLATLRQLDEEINTCKRTGT